MKVYSKDELLPMATNEINLRHSLMDPKKSMWLDLYKNNPDNYWCKVFIDRMSSATQDEISIMSHYGVRIEQILAQTVGRPDSITPEEEREVVTSIVRHLEFFHKMNEHFFDVVIELCDRAKDCHKEMPWLEPLILSNPKLLSQNPLLGMLSTTYTSIISRSLLANKEKVLSGYYSDL